MTAGAAAGPVISAAPAADPRLSGKFHDKIETLPMIPRSPLLAATLVAAAVILGTAGTASAQQTHTVEISRFAFDPPTLEVSVGDTVVWVNTDIVPHTATATAGDWDSGRMDKDQSWSLEILEPGTSDYLCLFHPNMRGTLIAN